MFKSENCNLPALLSPNECQCCVYSFWDVSWFLYSSLVRPGPVSLNTTTTDYYAPWSLSAMTELCHKNPPRLLSAAAVLPSISESRTHWVNTQRPNVFPLNENHAQTLMKRMRTIDWADTNTTSQTHIQMLCLTNWIGTIDCPSEGDSERLFLFSLLIGRRSSFVDWRD